LALLAAVPLALADAVWAPTADALLVADVSPSGTAALTGLVSKLAWVVVLLCTDTLALLAAVPVALLVVAWAPMADVLLVAAAALTPLALVPTCPVAWADVAAVWPFRALDVA
jgi:hypothetical protein